MKHAMASSNDLQLIAFASYCLHCIKWTESTTTSTLAHTDMILEAVEALGAAYVRIGYLPAASWIYQRALRLCYKDHDELSAEAGKRLRELGAELYRLHCDSESAIADPSLDISLLKEMDVWHTKRECPSLVDIRQEAVPRNLCLLKLRELAVHNSFLQSSGSGLSHADRLDALLGQTVVPHVSCIAEDRQASPQLVSLLIDEKEQLWCEIRVKGRVGFSNVLCSNATRVALDWLGRLAALLEWNKESVTSESDKTQFVADRREADQRMGKLMAEMESALFGEWAESIATFLKPQRVVHLELADVLMGLPIEAFGLFSNVFPVRRFFGFRNAPPNPRRTVNFRYVLNPGGDCGSATSLQSLLDNSGWSGRSGVPTLSDFEFVSLLSEADLFLYSGHGGGEKHWSGASVQRLIAKPNLHAPAVALLMGCGSARPYCDYLSPFCTPFHYLIGGTRIVVGTLWDVLGRELDKVTGQIVLETQSVESVEVLIKKMPAILSASKQAAKLRYLSGASFVVYEA